jgi:hypothetical protein
MSNSTNQPLPPNDNDPVAKQRHSRRLRIPRLQDGSAFFVVCYMGEGVYAVFAADSQSRQFKIFQGASLADARTYLKGIQQPGDAIMMSDALRTLELLDRPTAAMRPDEGDSWQVPFLPMCELESVAGIEAAAPKVEDPTESGSDALMKPGDPKGQAGGSSDQSVTNPLEWFIVCDRYKPANRLSGIIDLTGEAEADAASRSGDSLSGDGHGRPDLN